MHPLLLEEVVRQHISDLHESAGRRRIARRPSRRRTRRGRRTAIWLERAPAR